MPYRPRHRVLAGAVRLAALVAALSAGPAALASGASAANKTTIVCGTPVNPARKCLCTRDLRWVCARMPNGVRRTFANACVAACDGASVIRCGKC